MDNAMHGAGNILPGTVLNLYPDSIGAELAGTVELLQKPLFKDVFSSLYILPTFFNSDLDRGFSIVDYGLNRELVKESDLDKLAALGIKLKLDLVLNHLSVNSLQFQDLLQRGDASAYRDFFIDWNSFWKDHGSKGPEGYVVPGKKQMDRLFMRKPGLPLMKVTLDDRSKRFFWNTFYRDSYYEKIIPGDFCGILPPEVTGLEDLSALVNSHLDKGRDLENITLGTFEPWRGIILEAVAKKKRYLGQVDLNARSSKVWCFYEETIKRLRSYGAELVRLDAFAYLHKEPGRENFFNRPETWCYLQRLNSFARTCGLVLLPEIHAVYGSGLHAEIARQGYPFYDFFFPGLVIDALESGNSEALLDWIKEIEKNNYQTVNMLGCHDGIPVLDLRKSLVNGVCRPGLLPDRRIDSIVDLLVYRGGRVKNLYDENGNKIAYYQVNTTFFSALGEDEDKLLLARALQVFMPGTPQVWYLDLFAGSNDYNAADRGGPAGHKEINRTNLSLDEVNLCLEKKVVLEQLRMIRLRNISPAFCGELVIKEVSRGGIEFSRHFKGFSVSLKANLLDHSYQIRHRDPAGREEIITNCRY